MTARGSGAPRASRDIVVPCTGKGHRVRLAGGLRLLASARCPRCRAPVDPLRWRRALAAMGNLRRPAGRKPVDRILHVAAVGQIGVVLSATLLLWGFADEWWPATVLLFGPRWVLLLPFLVLLPWSLFRDRTMAVVLAVVAVVGMGPLVGLRTGWRGVLPAGGEGPELRVATFNARGGSRLPSLDGLLAVWDADVVLFQECGGRLREQVEAQALPGMPLSVHTGGGLCLLTRLDLIETREMDREAFEFARGSGWVRSHVLDWNGRTITVTNLHLETQRAGLDLIRQGRIREAIPRLREKSFLRSVELRAARRWADALDGPGIVAGDFNTPPESRPYRAEWSGWTNAFSSRGRGLGGTRLNGWILARIDHVLVDDSWRVVDVEVGDDVGSDHLPVLVTLRLR